MYQWIPTDNVHRELNHRSKSLEAFKALAAEAIGESGYNTLNYILLADEYLKKETRNKMYGADNYYVAFLGEPSTTSPWMLQISGHHLHLQYYVQRKVDQCHTDVYRDRTPILHHERYNLSAFGHSA
ncbi:DUF3500 domain-containing protein [Paenibacillus sp. J2TS4]|uniref:DUF3500 domain-containing protein n=1 Tax=Paenibacillus sp. J2TS4 TaxID=2807194 RepID=UPI0035B529EC